MSDQAGWAFTFTIPLAYADNDPADLTERIMDGLQDAGLTWRGGRPEAAIGRLESDGTRALYVNADQNPGPTLANMASTVSAVSKRDAQRKALADRLDAYLANASPTQAQSVAAIKDLIRAVKALAG